MGDDEGFFYFAKLLLKMSILSVSDLLQTGKSLEEELEEQRI